MSEISTLGNFGLCISEDTVTTFQIGDRPMGSSVLNDPGFERSVMQIVIPQWLNVQGYNVYARGEHNLQCEEIEYTIKRNRLHPRLIDKQVKFLYGKGPHGYYITTDSEGTLQRKWYRDPEVFRWLESWQRNGIETSYTDFAMSLIRRFYTFYDYFAKHRFSMGAQFGIGYPIAGLELVENKHCRLATAKTFDALSEIPTYSDFRYIAFGVWGLATTKFKIYPRFDISEIHRYRYAAISHHRQSTVGDFYGCNETYYGTKPWIQGANDSPDYINSFLKNSLSAKIHIIIPDAWIASKRSQIKAICEENRKRKADGKPLLTYNSIEVGTDYSESFLVRYMNAEIKKATEFLSGKSNQGKSFVSYSFRTGQKEEERWRFETIDMKYKEYIEAMIAYDKRVDGVLVASMGLDPSITGISQEGVISKSGADVYYNYIVYLASLTADDEICSEAFNYALQVNFPKKYEAGYRIGYYREIPSRQSQVSEDKRLDSLNSG